MTNTTLRDQLWVAEKFKENPLFESWVEHLSINCLRGIEFFNGEIPWVGKIPPRSKWVREMQHFNTNLISDCMDMDPDLRFLCIGIPEERKPFLADMRDLPPHKGDRLFAGDHELNISFELDLALDYRGHQEDAVWKLAYNRYYVNDYGTEPIPFKLLGHNKEGY